MDFIDLREQNLLHVDKTNFILVIENYKVLILPGVPVVRERKAQISGIHLPCYHDRTKADRLSVELFGGTSDGGYPTEEHNQV